MATRQEIMIGHDLLTKMARMNDNIWWVSQVLQEKHPYTGEKLKIIGADEVERDATADELKNESIKVKDFAKKSKAEYDSFTSKVAKGDIRNGLDHFGKSTNDLDEDAKEMDSKIVGLENAIAIVQTKTEMADYGLSVALSHNPKVEAEPEMPLDIRAQNIINDVLDCLSFELQQRNPYTGDPHSYTLEVLLALLPTRLASITKLGISPDPDLASIIDYLNTNWTAADTLAKMADLGLYIDANLPKLPLIRRHWAL